MNRHRHITPILLVAFLSVPLLLFAQEENSFTRVIKRSKEKELNVTVQFGFGSLTIRAGKPENIVYADYDGSPDAKVTMDYFLDGTSGVLEVSSHRKGSSRKSVSDLLLQLNPDVPLTLTVEIGAGDSKIDLTDLRLQNFQVSSGAGEVEISARKANESTVSKMEINSGVGSITFRGIGHLNFEEFLFNNGVGSYTLDLSGDMRGVGNVLIQTGMGSGIVIIPRNAQAHITTEGSFLSNFEVDRSIPRVAKNEYKTDEYDGAERGFRVKVKAGVGSVDIRRR